MALHCMHATGKEGKDCNLYIYSYSVVENLPGWLMGAKGEAEPLPFISRFAPMLAS